MSWFLIQCKANQQQPAETNLGNKDFELYTPMSKLNASFAVSL